MMFFYGFGCHGNVKPLWRIQTWILERLFSLSCASGDLRWAIVLLALRSSAAVWVLARIQLAPWIRTGRAGPGGERGSLPDVTDADNMLAAGGG